MSRFISFLVFVSCLLGWKVKSISTLLNYYSSLILLILQGAGTYYDPTALTVQPQSVQWQLLDGWVVPVHILTAAQLLWGGDISLYFRWNVLKVLCESFLCRVRNQVCRNPPLCCWYRCERILPPFSYFNFRTPCTFQSLMLQCLFTYLLNVQTW